MTYNKYLLFALLLLPAPAALGAREITSFGGDTLSFGSGNVPAPSSYGAAPEIQLQAGSVMPRRKYTVMLYMNGKNNLGTYMARKLVQLEKVGSDANINIVEELGLVQPKPACSTCAAANMYGASWSGTRRFYVRRNSDAAAVKIGSSLLIPSDENSDMGDAKNLAAFITWAKTNFPAEKYIVVVGNHGGAWVDRQKKPKENSEKGVSYDDVTGNYITTPEIGAALREAGGADVLIFDDCLMQAAEVASEVRGAAKFILGSEEISYTNHFRPDLLFAPLKANPYMEPAAFVDMFMKTYTAYNTERWNATKKCPGTMSLIDTSKIPGLEAAVKKYAAAALAVQGAEARKAFRQAMQAVLRYHYEYCADLYDFVENAQLKMKAAIAGGGIAESQQTRDLDAAAEELKSYVSGRLVLKNFTFGNAGPKVYAKSHGVSVYIPGIKIPADAAAAPTFVVASSTLATKYTDMQFDKATGWSLFVKYLTGK
ncbi:MAG TPA: clostripain-related cysteine peptidase [Elusimicrobiales bacterium]|nr:clostripain-related cysteine peptidase [Elusimicrobiales bacterium]